MGKCANENLEMWKCESVEVGKCGNVIFQFAHLHISHICTLPKKKVSLKAKPFSLALFFPQLPAPFVEMEAVAGSKFSGLAAK